MKPRTLAYFAAAIALAILVTLLTAGKRPNVLRVSEATRNGKPSLEVRP